MRAVLFDLDDTLFDHRHSLRAGLEAIQSKYDCFSVFTLDEFEKQHIALLNEIHFNQILKGEISADAGRELRFKRAFNILGIDASGEMASEAARFYRENYKNNERLKPGALKLLRRIKKDFKVGIVTNNMIDEQSRKLKNGGITSFIDVMVTSEEVGVTKPDALIFEVALERLGCSANEAVMLGDSWEVDMMGACKLGMKCIWINTYNEQRECDGIAVEIKSLENTEMIVNLINNYNG